MLGFGLQQRLGIPTLFVRGLGGLATVFLLSMLLGGCDGQSAQGGSRSPEAAVSEKAAVEEAVRGLFEALDAGNFEKAYSHIKPKSEFLNGLTQQQYVQNWRTTGLKGASIHSLQVEDVSGSTATAIVDFDHQYSNGTYYRWFVTWKLVKLDGQWKLDKSVSSKLLESPNEATSQSASTTQTASPSAAATAASNPFVGYWRAAEQEGALSGGSLNITKEGAVYRVVVDTPDDYVTGTYTGDYVGAGRLLMHNSFCGEYISYSEASEELHWCGTVFTKGS
jgi:hypothetical protein